MIIWVNGAFGAGKTSVVEALRGHLPDALVYDPEEVGFMLRHLVPPSPTGDFQDLPIWRRLVVTSAVELRATYQADLLVPMTLVDAGYRREILGGLAAAGEEVRHVFLAVRPEVLRQRIRDQVMAPGDPGRDEEVRAWRLAQVDRCVAAQADLEDATRILDASTRSPEDLAAEVIHWGVSVGEVGGTRG